MIKGIIFDLDGTTISTLEDIRDALNRTLDKYGYPIKTLDEVRRTVGKGSLKLIKDSMMSDVPDDTIEQLLAEYIETYGKNFNVKSKPYEGIPELLKTLQSKGIMMAINSNKPDSITKMLIEESFPDISFIAVTGQQNDIPRKPDPTTANIIIDKMGLDKNEVLYVGDSETDIETAKNAHLVSIGCLWGFRDYETLEKSGADHIIAKPEQLLDYLGEE